MLKERGDILFHSRKTEKEKEKEILHINNIHKYTLGEVVDSLITKINVVSDTKGEHANFLENPDSSHYHCLFRHFLFLTLWRQLWLSSSKMVSSSHTNRKSSTCLDVNPGEQ